MFHTWLGMIVTDVMYIYKRYHPNADMSVVDFNRRAVAVLRYGHMTEEDKEAADISSPVEEAKFVMVDGVKINAAVRHMHTVVSTTFFGKLRQGHCSECEEQNISTCCLACTLDLRLNPKSNQKTHFLCKFGDQGKCDCFVAHLEKLKC